jgi:hypothetical protein
MKRKWLWMAVSALALAGTALAGCGQQEVQQPESPIIQPTQTDQPDGTATTTPMQPAAPANTATLEPIRAPEASAPAAEATAVSTPGAPAGEADTGQASKEAVDKAKADLAEKLGIPTGEIAVGVVIGQEFSTNAFYCRTTKDRIAQDDSPAAISGFSILLTASGRRYEYHASGQTVVFCRPLT